MTRLHVVHVVRLRMYCTECSKRVVEMALGQLFESLTNDCNYVQDRVTSTAIRADQRLMPQRPRMRCSGREQSHECGNISASRVECRGTRVSAALEYIYALFATVHVSAIPPFFDCWTFSFVWVQHPPLMPISMDVFSTFATSALILLLTQIHDSSDAPLNVSPSTDPEDLQVTESDVPVDMEKSPMGRPLYWCVVA
jgi:hypothetical protein